MIGLLMNERLKGEKSPRWVKFGCWVEEQRTNQRFTITECAKRSDMSVKQWSRIEDGESGTKEDTIDRIADALNVPRSEARRAAGYLPEETNELTYEPDFTDAIEAGWSQLSEDARQEILEIIRMKRDRERRKKGLDS